MPVKTAAKEQEDKYFTPELEDLRVGYECEMNWDKGYNEAWTPLIISIKDKNGAYLNTIQDVLIAIDDGYGEVRVPYLTKEQIEAEGWRGFGEAKIEGRYGFEKGNHFLILDTTSIPVIDIIIKDPSKSEIIKNNFGIERNPELFRFQCECKDINTFRYICKLLNIK